jgi:hypothetical protein
MVNGVKIKRYGIMFGKYFHRVDKPHEWAYNEFTNVVCC